MNKKKGELGRARALVPSEQEEWGLETETIVESLSCVETSKCKGEQTKNSPQGPLKVRNERQ